MEHKSKTWSNLGQAKLKVIRQTACLVKFAKRCKKSPPQLDKKVENIFSTRENAKVSQFWTFWHFKFVIKCYFCERGIVRGFNIGVHNLTSDSDY